MDHIIYKTTNITNGKYYIGKHSTSNVEDGYLGSGKLLQRAIKKYGIENFSREILFYCDSEKEALEIEKKLVTEKTVKDKNSYNVTLGGFGTWYNVNQNHNNKNNKRQTGNFGWKERCKDDEFFSQRVSEGLKEYYKDHPGTFTDHKHSEKTKQIIGKKNSKAQSGKKNSQYGKCWIYNDTESKSIPKSEINSYLESGWIKGRKIIFS